MGGEITMLLFKRALACTKVALLVTALPEPYSLSYLGVLNARTSWGVWVDENFPVNNEAQNRDDIQILK